MFNFFRKQKQSDTNPNSKVSHLRNEILTLKGLDCPSCAINLDISLEETPGIITTKTNYAKSECHITFDPNIISLKNIQAKITETLSS